MGSGAYGSSKCEVFTRKFALRLCCTPVETKYYAGASAINTKCIKASLSEGCLIKGQLRPVLLILHG
jgi:hypothetical protein